MILLKDDISVIPTPMFFVTDSYAKTKLKNNFVIFEHLTAKQIEILKLENLKPKLMKYPLVLNTTGSALFGSLTFATMKALTDMLAVLGYGSWVPYFIFMVGLSCGGVQLVLINKAMDIYD